ncbi:MAG: Ig-like domain-containing protein [Gemmatimonadota bacterium]|nr:Ig-like domain-containing protein [Gemmatimonadota bacterium]
MPASARQPTGRPGSFLTPLTAGVVLALAGCLTSPDLPEAAVIEIVSGDDQIQGRGRTLHEPIVVRALDGAGFPIAGLRLRFSSLDHGTVVDPPSVTTDSLGQAAASWTLGLVAGTQTLTASVPARRGPSVEFTATARQGDFDIQIVFDTAVATEHRIAIRNAAERWTAVIVGDLPDQLFERGFLPAYHCQGVEELLIPPGGVVDDVRLGVRIERDPNLAYRLAHCSRRETEPSTLLAQWSVSAGLLDAVGADLEGWTTHLIGHLLGFGWGWGDRRRNAVRDEGLGADTHFPDPATVAAFDAAGGAAWTGSKVPVQNHGPRWLVDTHWRESVMSTEIMSPDFTEDLRLKPFRELSLSAITVQAMAAIGYEVDVNEADAYTLPTAGVAAEPAASRPRSRQWGDIEQRTVAIFDASGRVVSVTRRR